MFFNLCSSRVETFHQMIFWYAFSVSRPCLIWRHPTWIEVWVCEPTRSTRLTYSVMACRLVRVKQFQSCFPPAPLVKSQDWNLKYRVFRNWQLLSSTLCNNSIYSRCTFIEVFDQKGRWLANSAREDFQIEPAPTSTLPSVVSMLVQNNMHLTLVFYFNDCWGDGYDCKQDMTMCETRWSQTSKQDVRLHLRVNALRWVGEWRVWQGHIITAAFARCCSSSIPPGLSLCICRCCSLCCMVFSVC